MIINLTDDTVTILLGTGETLGIPTSGKIAYISSCKQVIKRYHDKVPLVALSPGPIINLPDPQPETLFIVTEDVRLAAPERKDLASVQDTLYKDWFYTGNTILGHRNLIVNS